MQQIEFKSRLIQVAVGPKQRVVRNLAKSVDAAFAAVGGFGLCHVEGNVAAHPRLGSVDQTDIGLAKAIDTGGVALRQIGEAICANRAAQRIEGVILDQIDPAAIQDAEFRGEFHAVLEEEAGVVEIGYAVVAEADTITTRNAILCTAERGLVGEGVGEGDLNAIVPDPQRGIPGQVENGGRLGAEIAEVVDVRKAERDPRDHFVVDIMAQERKLEFGLDVSPVLERPRTQ